MTLRAFYNDTDAFCCAWLSNLMDAELITPGKIDQRDVREVSADDVSGYERVHLFAGIGGWDLALSLAGWRGPVWTGKLPLPPLLERRKKEGLPIVRWLQPCAVPSTNWLLPMLPLRPRVARRRATPMAGGVATRPRRQASSPLWRAGVER